MRAFNHWEQALGLEVTSCEKNSRGNLVLYFDEAIAYLELEPCQMELSIGIQPINSRLDDATWLPESVIEGRRILRFVVPFTNERNFDARVLVNFEPDFEIFIASEIESVPVRIT